MDPNSDNNKSTKRKVVDQLVDGYDFATQLQLLLSRRNSNDQTRVVSGEPDLLDELVVKILDSFHNTISVLDSFEPVAEVSVPIAFEGSLNASCAEGSVAPGRSNGGDSGESRKRLGVGKGKRGCYIRKKRSHSWTVEARSIEDKYAWRKYGQKEILNTKFPRSYFRCTYKQTQGCKATKQVQKMEQDHEMFQITYIGHHTCNVNDQTQGKVESFDHETIMDSNNTFDAKVQNNENGLDSVILGKSMVKEEGSNNGDHNKDYCEGSSTDGDLSLVWQDVMMFDDHQRHQNRYYNGETSTASQNFTFIDNDQLSSLFDSYCTYEGTRAI